MNISHHNRGRWSTTGIGAPMLAASLDRCSCHIFFFFFKKEIEEKS